MRDQAPVAFRHCRQFSIMESNGDSVRAMMTLAATMVPGEMPWSILRMAP